MIPYGHQTIDESDIAAVAEVMRSDRLAQGPTVERFEESVAAYAGCSHAVAVSSGTAALHLAYLAMGVGPTSRVLVPAVTFRATATAALQCGASVIYADVDETGAIVYPEGVFDLVVPVHLAGDPVALPHLSGPVLEDACHALGAHGIAQKSYGAVFSFHPVKSITTGEGGMFVTNHEGLADEVRAWRQHGHSVGFNYRMDEMSAALGLSQMKRIDSFISRRLSLAVRYSDLLKDLPVSLPHQHYGAWHLYQIGVDNAAEVNEKMHTLGIGTQRHYKPLASLPGAEAFWARTLSLPLYPTLTEAQQDFVVSTLRKAIA